MPPTVYLQAGDERVQTSVERMQVGPLLLAHVKSVMQVNSCNALRAVNSRYAEPYIGECQAGTQWP